MKLDFASKGASRYVVGKVERFDQKNEMFCRSRWDPSQSELGKKMWAPEEPRKDTPGYALRDYALEDSGWFFHYETKGASVIFENLARFSPIPQAAKRV
ncbi:hypothetical protein ACFLV4_04045 [Chloroflexota bacterium]